MLMVGEPKLISTSPYLALSKCGPEKGQYQELRLKRTKNLEIKRRKNEIIA